MQEITKHYLISGRVQGVGYRRFTQTRANELGLSGWVRNLNDGRVEALAQGPENDLLRLETVLRSGPAHGYVESLVISSLQAQAKLQGFEVRKDGAEPWPKK